MEWYEQPLPPWFEEVDSFATANPVWDMEFCPYCFHCGGQHHRFCAAQSGAAKFELDVHFAHLRGYQP